MAKYRLTNIASMCVAGHVIQPDANGIAEIPDSVTSSPDFSRLLREFRNGEKVEAADDAQQDTADDAPAKKGKKKVQEAAEEIASA
jgi:hypothetical protein